MRRAACSTTPACCRRSPPRTSTRASANSAARSAGASRPTRAGHRHVRRGAFGRDALRARGDRRDARRRHQRPRAPRSHPAARPALRHHRRAEGARADVRHPQPGERRVGPALRPRRRPARRGARGARRHGDRQRPPVHRAQPHRPHAPGQAPARAPARHPARADGRALPGRRRAQRGRRRLLRRLPALARPSGRSSWATSRARAPRPPPSPRWRATRCAPPRWRTRRRAPPCGGSTARCSTTTRRSSRPSWWPTCAAGPEGSIELRVALAGHPAPAIVRRDGASRWSVASASWRGCVPTSTCTTSRSASTPGDVLLLYTDGVTEAGPRDAPFGEAGLVSRADGPRRPIAAGGRRRRRAGRRRRAAGRPARRHRAAGDLAHRRRGRVGARVAPRPCPDRYGTGPCPSRASTCP